MMCNDTSSIIKHAFQQANDGEILRVMLLLLHTLSGHFVSIAHEWYKVGFQKYDVHVWPNFIFILLC